MGDWFSQLLQQLQGKLQGQNNTPGSSNTNEQATQATLDPNSPEGRQAQMRRAAGNPMLWQYGAGMQPMRPEQMPPIQAGQGYTSQLPSLLQNMMRRFQ